MDVDLRPLDLDLRSLERDLRSLERDLRPLDRDLRPLDRDLRPLERDLRSLDSDLRPLDMDLRPREAERRFLEEVLDDDVLSREVDLLKIRFLGGGLLPLEGDLFRSLDFAFFSFERVLLILATVAGASLLFDLAEAFFFFTSFFLIFCSELDEEIELVDGDLLKIFVSVIKTLYRAFERS